MDEVHRAHAPGVPPHTFTLVSGARRTETLCGPWHLTARRATVQPGTAGSLDAGLAAVMVMAGSHIWNVREPVDIHMQTLRITAEWAST